MAITDINISEQLETDAPSIKYTGNEGPQASPQHQQEQMIAQQIWEALDPEQQGQFQSFEQFFQSGVWKQILQQMQADEGQGQGQGPQAGIGSLGPRNMEQQMPMPNRMGAEYGGRMGYDNGGLSSLDFVDKIYSDEARALAGNIPEIRKGSQYAPTLFEERTDAGEWKYPGKPREGQEYLTSTLQGANTILDKMEMKKQRLKELAVKKGLNFNDLFQMELDRIYDIEGPATKKITKIKDRERILDDMQFKLTENLYAQGGRIGARFGGDMEKLSMRETIDTPEGIETLQETDTMKMAGGGDRGWKAQMLAQDLAQEKYGKDFYDLSDDMQHEIYTIALDMIDSGGE